MTEYLAELYVARTGARAAECGAARITEAAEEQTRNGAPVRLVRSIFVPEDETCFLLFEACSADAVRDAARLADVPCEHVAAVVGGDEHHTL